MRLLTLLLLVQAALALLTTRAANSRHQSGSVLEGLPTESLNISVPTSCSSVDLRAKYNYTGLVRSGYLTVGRGASSLAFLFYGRKDVMDQSQLKNSPTIIWLNGGPSTSSQLGNFQEIGPIILKKIFSIVPSLNNNTWANNFNLLFVDQPVGTGLSFVDKTSVDPFVHSMGDVANDFYYALDQLYNNLNGCFNSRYLDIPATAPLYIFGQGYAGKYIPAIAKKITESKQSGGFLKGLRGIGIGNPFTSPFDVISQFGTYSFEMGLLDYQERTHVEKILLRASSHFAKDMWSELHADFDECLDYIFDKTGVNLYDIREDGSYQDVLSTYFADSSILTTYNLNPSISFGQDSQQVFKELDADFMKSETKSVEYLLRNKVPVLVYNSQLDLVVGTPGTMRWVDRLAFSGNDEFRDATFSAWKINGEVVGSVKKGGLLEFRVVNKAGHYPGMNQPAAMLDLVQGFVTRTQSIFEENKQ